MKDESLAVGLYTFRNWPTIGVESLAFRFEPEDSRTGIYILTFADGWRYVGQSLSVVNRFAAHRRRWNNITHIAFRPFVASELNTREREVLAAIEAQGHLVRNIDLAGHPGGVSLLDIVIEEQAQVEWLDSVVAEPSDSPRYLAASRRISGLQRFQELMGRSDSKELINAAASYVGSAIPWPSQTEGRFWTATAMATTGKRKDWRRLVTISAQNAEVLVLGEVTTNAGTSVEGFINIDKNVTGIESWIRQRRLKARLGAGTYGTIGEVGQIEFTGATAVSALFADGGPIEKSAKTLALNLMRKGPSMYSRFHNDHLADAIFNQLTNMGSQQ